MVLGSEIKEATQIPAPKWKELVNPIVKPIWGVLALG